MGYHHYFAFGDSISIDDYAGPALGAASLLYRNDDGRWPEFRGRDLLHLEPGCQLHLEAYDGATLEGCHRQLDKAPRVKGRCLVTLTVGGNDLLSGAGRDYTLDDWEKSLSHWFQRLREQVPNPTVLLGNVYDPSDGTDHLASGDDSLRHLRPYFVAANALLARVAEAEGARAVDIHSHFLGHALTEPAWIHCEIEPTALGASEVRRLFWDSL